MPINPSLLGAMECGIFWDYENIRVPKASDASEVSNTLRQIVTQYGRVVTRRIYYDSRKSSEKHVPRAVLDNSGFSLQDCPARGSKETIDKKIIVDVMAFALERVHAQRPVLVALLTSDGDFAYMLSRLRDLGVHVLVIHEQQCETLMASASLGLRWTEDVLGDGWRSTRQLAAQWSATMTDWREIRDPGGDPYYWSDRLQQSRWHNPTDSAASTTTGGGGVEALDDDGIDEAGSDADSIVFAPRSGRVRAREAAAASQVPRSDGPAGGAGGQQEQPSSLLPPTMLPPPPSPAAPGFLFHCSNGTLPEVQRLMLMGAPMAQLPQMSACVAEGLTRIFLYNTQAKEIHGPYRPRGPAAPSIEPDAFCGKYPAQQRVAVDEQVPLRCIEVASVQQVASRMQSGALDAHVVASLLSALAGRGARQDTSLSPNNGKAKRSKKQLKRGRARERQRLAASRQQSQSPLPLPLPSQSPLLLPAESAAEPPAADRPPDGSRSHSFHSERVDEAAALLQASAVAQLQAKEEHEALQALRRATAADLASNRSQRASPSGLRAHSCVLLPPSTPQGAALQAQELLLPSPPAAAFSLSPAIRVMELRRKQIEMSVQRMRFALDRAQQHVDAGFDFDSRCQDAYAFNA